MRERKKRYCIECGAELTSGQQKYCSIDCRKNFENKKKDKYQVLKKSSMPSKQILINDLSLMNITKIGKKYGVSDSAVRKWLKKI